MVSSYSYQNVRIILCRILKLGDPIFYISAFYRQKCAFSFKFPYGTDVAKTISHLNILYIFAE